jgi:hypothetical protein
MRCGDAARLCLKPLDGLTQGVKWNLSVTWIKHRCDQVDNVIVSVRPKPEVLSIPRGQRRLTSRAVVNQNRLC